MSIQCIDIINLLRYNKIMKTEQLQIRVSPEAKSTIRKRAQAANMDMSEWILSILFPPASREFQSLVAEVAKQRQSSNRFYAFAALSDFLHGLEPETLAQAVSDKAETELDEFIFNYIAAMVELACHQKKISPPTWIQEAQGLSQPYFGSSLLSLRLYLMTHSPVPFKKRNIFIDSSVGDRL
jgi:uncharacterized protein (DUF1778 family)